MLEKQRKMSYFSVPGSSSLMAVFSKPLQSSELYGETTFRPGTEPYQAAKHCECCAATPTAAPFGPRKTIGTLTCPHNTGKINK